RVEAGQLKLSPEPVPARELLQRAIAKAFDLVGQRPIEVVLELAQTMPALRADPLRGTAALAVPIAHAMGGGEPGGGVPLRGAADGRGAVRGQRAAARSSRTRRMSTSRVT